MTIQVKIISDRQDEMTVLFGESASGAVGDDGDTLFGLLPLIEPLKGMFSWIRSATLRGISVFLHVPSALCASWDEDEHIKLTHDKKNYAHETTSGDLAARGAGLSTPPLSPNFQNDKLE